MKKFLDMVIRILREGIPLGKSLIEFAILTTPFIRRSRGYCPMCNTTLWEQMPEDPLAVMEKHMKICPKKEKVNSK